MLVYMIQTNKYTWEIRSSKGHLIQGDISLNNAYQAKEYIKKYVSSFQNWDYELKPLEDI